MVADIYVEKFFAGSTFVYIFAAIYAHTVLIMHAILSCDNIIARAVTFIINTANFKPKLLIFGVICKQLY